MGDLSFGTVYVRVSNNEEEGRRATVYLGSPLFLCNGSRLIRSDFLWSENCEAMSLSKDGRLPNNAT